MNRQPSLSPQIFHSRRSNNADLHRRLMEINALYSVNKTTSTATTLDEIIESTTQIVGETLYPHSFGVCLWNADSGKLEPHISYRTRTEHPLKSLEPGEGLVGTVFVSGEVIRVDNVLLDQRYFRGDRLTRSELCVPLWGKDGILGVINAESTEIGAFNEADERLMEALAIELTNAMEMIRLLEAEQRRRQESERLREATAALTSTLDMDQVIQRILIQLEQVVPYISITMMLVENDQLEIRAVRGFHSPDQMKILLDVNQFQHLREILVTARPGTIPDTYQDPRWQVRDGSEYIRCWMGVPMKIHEKVIGILNLDHTEVGRYTEEDAEMAMAFANQAAVAVENAQLFKNLEDTNRALSEAYDATIEGWSHALELRDRETEGHTLRVTALTMRMAEAAGIRGDELTSIRHGALLHDIGKMGIPDSILLKPGSLTETEWEVMRQHPEYARRLLSGVPRLQSALDIPYCHHERWDGSGYPRGLREKDIPFAARLFAVADVYDALTTDRPYRLAWTRETAMVYIRSQSGKGFDPQAVEIFLGLENID